MMFSKIRSLMPKNGRNLLLQGLFALLVLCLSLRAVAAPDWLSHLSSPAAFNSEQLNAELVTHAPQGITAGEAFWLGLKIDHQPDWHTYWKNPGDVGSATQMKWTLPHGIEVVEEEWPVPQVLKVSESITDYGYEGQVLLPVRFVTTDAFDAAGQSEIEVALDVRWLACRVECVPVKANLSIKLPVAQATVTQAALFTQTWTQIPTPLPTDHAEVTLVTNAETGVVDTLLLQVEGLPTDWAGEELLLFPEQKRLIVNSGPKAQKWQGGVWQGSYALAENRLTAPEHFEGVLQLAASKEANAIKLTAPVVGEWPALETFSIPPSQYDAEVGIEDHSKVSNIEKLTKEVSIWGIIGAAFLGGLILNLMPCVFPVLSITALSFSESSGTSARQQKVNGLAYGAGVIVTMLTVATFLLMLRMTGESVAWGFQLQSPWFISLLAGLFVLIGLNLLGAFEVLVIPFQSVASWQSKKPLLNAFFSGIVSVLVATPCTAPFMSGALAVALILPVWQTLVIFLALGVGLALPLVLIAFIPQVARWLPKPGAWMQTFRHLMAFPMFATALWLVWVLSIQVGEGAAIGLMGILLALAFLTWVLGWCQRTALQSKVWKAIAALIGVTIFVLVWIWFSPKLHETRPLDGGAQVTQSSLWRPWSQEAVEAVQGDGRPVFINFTAAWCATCQVNKVVALEQDKVLKAFAQKGVVLFEADWTHRDAAITEELARLERAGVPVYALYAVGSEEPQLLPELLTPSIVLDALATLPDGHSGV